MRLIKPRQPMPVCEYIIQPGDYTIPLWDNTQCTFFGYVHCETHIDGGCDKWFCYDHWPNHMDTEHPVAEMKEWIEKVMHDEA